MNYLKVAVSILVASLLVAVNAMAPVRTPAERLSTAAAGFLATLDDGQRERAMLSFDDAYRFDWHYVPRERRGVRLDELSQTQSRAAQELLRAGLSSQGYLKTNAIVELESELRELERAHGGTGESRDPGAYTLTFFGTPAHDQWAWRFEGHHISLNFTVGPGERVEVTPAFFGANPGALRDGLRAGFEVLADEEELGLRLVNSLTPEQQEVAIIGERGPGEILLTPGKGIDAVEPDAGLAAQFMSPEQRRLLGDLVAVYVNNFEPDLAREQLERIGAADPSEIRFAWIGATDRHEAHYYRVRGPSWCFELDNSKPNEDHIHAVWRDGENEFGHQALVHHLQSEHSGG